MSTNTTPPDTHDTPTTDGPATRPDGAAPDLGVTDRAATASDLLWAALHARPGGTTDELSGDAGIGRSTAAKILARWVADGTATRVPTDGKRSASRYAVPAPVDATPPDGVNASATGPGGPHSGQPGAPDTGLTDRAAATTTEGIDNLDIDDATDQGGEPGDTTTPDAPTDVPSGTDDAEVPADTATASTGSTPSSPPGTDHRAETPGAIDSDSITATSESDGTVSAPTTGPVGGDGTDSVSPAVTAGVRGPRLAAGALHGMVEDYLRDHPGEELGPTKIGRDLGRSSGAVANSLERLVTSGYAVRTKDRPKRYALATTGTADHTDPHHSGELST